ncbi:MAG TPA: metal-dependent transcriptional regulator [Candidatus Sulfotelmatobacter sp.]|jgi:DtxR family Mn-dependent transcriptional regulator|nr:metal-dependent transcriptional regulator [Candidatus Sulfotelmatobacter sp.]
MPSSAVEDYLKRIFLEQTEDAGKRVPTGQIAQALGVTPGTATAMIKTLAGSGLVAYEPYAGVRLTEAGLQLATHVVRRHRLVELFLVEVMGMDWSEVHADAEVLEHAVSERLIERIDAMLGFPAADPHGDPIPGAGERLAERRELASLATCPLVAPHRVARITDQRADFLRLVESHGLKPGRRVVVLSREELADTVLVQGEPADPLRLGFRAAARVLVAPDGGSAPADRQR